MKSFLAKFSFGAALAATALTTAAPASAQSYYGHHRDNTGTALIAGLAGLAIGAAIVASSDHHRDRDSYYYRDNRYDQRPVRYDYDRGYPDQRGYDRPGYDYDHGGDYRGWNR